LIPDGREYYINTQAISVEISGGTGGVKTLLKESNAISGQLQPLLLEKL
jgi:hypothetical protein